MILNIRGTHGTGKTYISHKLILDHQHSEGIEPSEVQGKRFRKPNVFHIEGGVKVVGRWQSGMDGIFPQTIIEEMLEYWAPQGTLIWENVMVSGNIGRWAELAHRLEPVNHSVWAFLDTPLELCIERVMARRAEARANGFNHRQSDDAVKLDVLAGHWRRVRRAAARAYLEGIDVRWIDHTKSYEQVYSTLYYDGSWRPATIDSNMLVAPLEKWEPAQDELEYVLQTAKVPWFPEDQQTKVDFKRKPRENTLKVFSTPVSFDALGSKIVDWATGEEVSVPPKAERPAPAPFVEANATVALGEEVQPWGANTLVTSTENNPGGLVV